MKRQCVTSVFVVLMLSVTVSAQAPATRGTGDQRRQYVFAPTGQQLEVRRTLVLKAVDDAAFETFETDRRRLENVGHVIGGRK